MTNINISVNAKNWEEVSAYAEEAAFLNATELLLELLDAKGWTRKELAARVKRDPAEITRMLSGKRNITLRTLAELFAALGYTIGLRTNPIEAASGRKRSVTDLADRNWAAATIIGANAPCDGSELIYSEAA